MARTDEQPVTAENQEPVRRGGDYRSGPQPPNDRPSPYSYQDIRQRLERLPRGHPSCPFNADGSRKPPPPNLRELELPPGDDFGTDTRARASNDRSEPKPERLEPFTDPEHAEHVRYVSERLDWAHAEGLATNIRYTTDPDGEQWTPNRAVLHREVLDELYSRAASVPCDRKAVMAGGLGGAGKSTVLEEHAGIDRSQYLTINPDDIKELMAERGLIPEVEGLSPMEASDLVHEESSYLAKQLALHSLADGKNVIWDITMSSRGSVESRLTDLGNSGYATAGVFVDIPAEVSVQRAEDRYRHGHEDYRNGVGQGGRYVPPEVIRRQADPEWGSVNRRTFEQIKDRFDDWAVYDNSIYGRPPILVASGGKPQDVKEEA